jgi:hypothetical protein
VAGVVLAGLASNGWGTDLSRGPHKIELVDISDEQRRILDQTFDQMKALQPGKLGIDGRLYRRLTRFETLFGKPFNGSDLEQWVLARFRKILYGNSALAAINQNQGDLIVGNLFFHDISPLERLYLLVHEARHSDGDGYPHVRCPKDFPFISAAQPGTALDQELACDASADGAYAFQAALLFELFAYGLFDQKNVGLVYNSTVPRILRPTK